MLCEKWRWIIADHFQVNDVLKCVSDTAVHKGSLQNGIQPNYLWPILMLTINDDINTLLEDEKSQQMLNKMRH